ncbi:uncharacterized protein EDB93DRAFT_1325352 [Suillus bovinus]|uniref:uncharacterized protein n=1 Tax=Suillus bovinus TaxID=48563 RepID=UPI001B87FEA0|nr:uncharacterized protein EDB93DRAFT_1325352 [Suillus bovinus]KAG2158177.1 hypothetical protein EDB93DRAFT_1325352 [Suillus bovinus]
MSELTPIITPLREFGGHTNCANAVAVFPDKQRMVTGSWDNTLRLWDLKKGVVLKKMEGHHSDVLRLAVSRDGQLIASGDWRGGVIVWHGETGEILTQILEAHFGYIISLDFSPDGTVLATTTREHIASFKAHTSYNCSLTWTPDGTRLLTGGDYKDPTIREWDTTTWQQVGEPWTGHTKHILAIAINPAGTLIASASDDKYVRLWRLSDRQTVATFKHKSLTSCVTFSADGKHILSGGGDTMISEWAVPPACLVQMLAITTARDACIDGHLSTAEELLTRDINTNANNHTSYAHRSFVMARRHSWDRALQDATESISIQPSLIGYISKGIALCGQGRVPDARAAFDVALIYTDQNPQILHFLLLIKSIALFNADQHDEANILLKELVTGCPNADVLGCCVVQAYMRVQLGIKALDRAHHEEAANHFTVVLNSSVLSWSLPIYSMYEDLVVLFGWDFKSLRLIAHQKQCQAFFSTGKVHEALELHRSMMDNVHETTKASCLDWSTASTEQCSAPFLTSGDTALAVSDFDLAIELYSAAIDLNFASDTIFANRSRARLGKMLWDEALLDAQMVIQLNPLSHFGYKLKYAALHGAQRYDEAMQAFRIMLSKLDDAPDTETRKLRQQYLSPSEVDRAIRKVIDAQLDSAPLRIIDTTTGLLCDREMQIRTFKMSIEYKELVSSTITHPDIQMKRIEEVVMTYFQYVMLSHRWEDEEPLLQDIQGEDIYELDPVGGTKKLQFFCKTARDLGCNWAWSDTCCIDKNTDVELQASVKSMFAWYRNSAFTVVYLSDVPPLSKPGALGKSVWNTRGWTVQEFLAPKVILFYQKDWTLYLDDHTPNHKESAVIMQELENVTGIDRQAVVAFRPGMRDAREKLQWASTRTTTLQEDIAYSLFGIFGVRLHVDYTEKKQNALGRLLQEIIAQSGDITALDWVGKSSEFNSCLPADISSYEAPPCKLPSLSEDEIQSFVSSLRGVVALQSALQLYQSLDCLSVPRFAHRRLHLPCIVFPVTGARRRPSHDQDTYTYELKSDGLHNLEITTEDKFTSFSPARPPPAWQTILLVRPWSRYLLGLHDTVDDTQSVGNWSVLESSLYSSPAAHTGPICSDSDSRALRLIVRHGQPFSAFLLARQRDGEFKRIASEHDIIAQVKDMGSISHLIDIRTLEVL